MDWLLIAVSWSLGFASASVIFLALIFTPEIKRVLSAARDWLLDLRSHR
jgi:hypothetical protein